MALKHARAEDIRYSIADEEQFKYLITRFHDDEQKAFEEIWERIRSRADKKINKKEMQEVFKKHVESAYSGDLARLNHRLTKILKYLVDDGCLRVELAERKPSVGKTEQGKMRESGWEFYRRMMGEDSYLRKIHDNCVINIPIRIVHLMGLEGGMPCKLGWEGDSLALSPLKETEMPVKIQSGSTLQKSSLIVGIRENMLLAGGLKFGDYASWSEKDGLLSLRKAEKDAPYAMKIRWIGGSSISMGINIPKKIAEKAHLELGQYGFWTFEDDGLNKSLWLEVGDKRNVANIIMSGRGYGTHFTICIPKDMRANLEKDGEVVLEVREGKLFIRPKQA